MSDLARYDVEEYEVADPAERQQAVRYEPGRPEGRADGERGPLPDYAGAGPTALRARGDQPVRRVAELAEQQTLPHEPGRPEGRADGERGPLAEFTGAGPTALRARGDQPVRRVAELAEQQTLPHEPGGPDGHPNDNHALLPDYTGVDLTALRAQVDHPVLGAVLATLLARSCSADGGLVAYHEDSPGAER
ncbi:hypothetical protein OG194_10140 [Streptomyces sp. NBC_01288]|uniref:hypothetical protein n=1 Tax=Streptomyces sp. NBC_01288 TaxID=2903814 RepID=UPI002E133538|nr:hypothetical protein OG194_10140 [Streptomyces sp. NBC_01288]